MCVLTYMAVVWPMMRMLQCPARRNMEFPSNEPSPLFSIHINFNVVVSAYVIFEEHHCDVFPENMHIFWEDSGAYLLPDVNRRNVRDIHLYMWTRCHDALLNGHAGLLGVWFGIKFLTFGRVASGSLRIMSSKSPFFQRLSSVTA